MTGDTRGSGGGPHTSTRGDIVATRLQECLPPNWRAELDLEGNLRRCDEVANSFCTTPTFPLFLAFCLATRGAWNAIHDAWLYDGGGQGSSSRQAAGHFMEILSRARRDIEAFPQSCVRGERERAEHYRNSILLRHGLVGLLLDDGLARVYQELVGIAEGRRQAVGGSVPSIGHAIREAVSRGLPPGRAQFASIAFEWLQHKLAILAAELSMEHGPYASSATSHRAIAVRTSDPVAGMLKQCGKELQQEARIDRVGPFLAQLDKHLATFQREVCKPLNDIADRIPADGAQVTDKSFEAEARACIEGLREFTLGFISEVEFWARQLDRRLQKPMPLSVLVFQELGSWIAHCLELDLVAQGANEQESLAALAELISVQLADMEGGEFEHPSPAPPPYFDAFHDGDDFGGTIVVAHEGVGSIAIRTVKASALPPLDLICSATE